MILTNFLNNKLSKESKNVSFFLSNKNRGFCWLGENESLSRYQGVFFFEKNKIFRVIESIEQKSELKEIKNLGWCVEKIRESSSEKFFMPDYSNSFFYETSGESLIFLDFKEAYKNDYAEYYVERLEDLIIVKLLYEGETFFLVVYPSNNFRFEGSFLEKDYPFDRNRNSFPDKRRVFFFGILKEGFLSFGFSKDKEEAIKNAFLFKEIKELEKQKKERILSLQKNFSREKVNLAYNFCRINLDNLLDDKGLIAGLPWFFQYWSRDELISLKGISFIDNMKAEEILKKWVNYLNKSFIMPAKIREDSLVEGESIDSFGWLLKRLNDFPHLLDTYKKLLLNFFDTLDDNLVETKNLTWMDSIFREKAIEIQAMKLFSLNLAFKMTQNKKFSYLEENLKKKVLEIYFKDGILLDSPENKDIRPNIFISYYFYPSLLKKEEWEFVFDKAIDSLWAEWGGFASLSKFSRDFSSSHTGENPKSYHNGDSWFWINNLAAKVLVSLNKEKYYEHIKKILNASTEEILFSGAAGCHSELSSFNSLKSEGAFCQSFSMAMYLELIEELRNL